MKKDDLIKEIKFKINLCGDEIVGKTSLMRRIADGKFTVGFPTIGADFIVKKIKLKDIQANIQIWDYPCANNQFTNILPSYFRKSDATIIMFRLNNKLSFENVMGWYKKVYELGRQQKTIMMIGNKNDCSVDERQITDQQIDKMRLKLGIKYAQISVKTGMNVEEALMTVIEEMLENRALMDAKQQEHKQCIKQKGKQKTSICRS